MVSTLLSREGEMGSLKSTVSNGCVCERKRERERVLEYERVSERIWECV